MIESTITLQTDSVEVLSSRQEFFNGLRGVMPLIVGVVPFGMIYGALAINSGLPIAAAQATCAIVFAGASQFAMVQLMGASASPWVIILTVAVLNLRHMLYSATIAPAIQHLSGRWKAVLAYFLTDEVFAVSILKLNREGISPNGHWYFLGAGIGLWSSWQLSSAAGIFMGAAIPSTWPLDFALALTFIAMVVPAIKNHAELAAALASGICAVALYRLPYNLGLVLAAMVGIYAGMLVNKGRTE